MTTVPTNSADGWKPATFRGVRVPGFMHVDPITSASAYSADGVSIEEFATPANVSAASPAAPGAYVPNTGGAVSPWPSAAAPVVVSAPASVPEARPQAEQPAIRRTANRPKRETTLAKYRAHWRKIKPHIGESYKYIHKKLRISTDVIGKVIALATAEGWD